MPRTTMCICNMCIEIIRHLQLVHQTIIYNSSCTWWFGAGRRPRHLKQDAPELWSLMGVCLSDITQMWAHAPHAKQIDINVFECAVERFARANTRQSMLRCWKSYSRRSFTEEKKWSKATWCSCNIIFILWFSDFSACWVGVIYGHWL